MKNRIYKELVVETPEEVMEPKVMLHYSFIKRQYMKFKQYRDKRHFAISLYEYWLMSFFSYSSKGTETQFKDKELNLKWEVVYFCDKKDGLQFYVFKCRYAPKYVVAFRGTDGLRDWTSNLLLVTNQSSQYKSAVKEISAFFSKSEGYYEVYLCGHSLGGAIAQKIYHSFHDRFNIQEVITFNSAGITLKEKEEFKSYKIRNYMIEKDVVSSKTGKHYGQIISVKPVNELTLIERHHLKAFRFDEKYNLLNKIQ